jgi:hypothetical protein
MKTPLELRRGRWAQSSFARPDSPFDSAQGRLVRLSPQRSLPWAACVVLAWSVLTISAFAQSAPTIYAESFRKGATKITEDSFEAKLSPDNATYRELIKDSRGNDRYELTITPQGPEGDKQITSWRVKLRDLHHAIYSNILLEEQQPSPDPKNNLWWLNPNRFGGVQIRTKRIMKVDGFYVVFQVKDLHFTPLDSPYLDTLVVQFTFTNTDPRSR